MTGRRHHRPVVCRGCGQCAVCGQPEAEHELLSTARLQAALVITVVIMLAALVVVVLTSR